MTFEIRAAIRTDEDALFELSEHLNSVNLPHDRAAIAKILDLSERSFSGEIEDPLKREYVFVMHDTVAKRAIATSMIIAQLGNREAPYLYFDVHEEERYSETLDALFKHQVLSMGYSYDGPTEIGGLVVHPDYRLSDLKLGLAISFVRFLFIAAHRSDFRDQILAELLPPLEADGTSHLWEAVGRRFTNLTYQEADKLSKRNKEFVRGLFPNGEIYASLLSPEARSVIGRVGQQTRGVEKMLRRIGFRYANRVDPFDGGPHFIAETDEISVMQNASTVEYKQAAKGTALHRGLVFVESNQDSYVSAMLGEIRFEAGYLNVSRELWDWLEQRPNGQLRYLDLTPQTW